MGQIDLNFLVLELQNLFKLNDGLMLKGRFSHQNKVTKRNREVNNASPPLVTAIRASEGHWTKDSDFRKGHPQIECLSADQPMR